MEIMKLTVQLHLRPDPAAIARLKATMERSNAAADWVAGKLFTRRMTNKIDAQKLLYRDVRERFGLSSQMAILCIHRSCEAYKRDKSIRPTFRAHAAITYDVRTMSFKGIDRVSLLTLDGRAIIPFVMGKYQAERFRHARKQADLMLRKDGEWFLLVTVDVPDGTPIPATDFVGVDLGLARIATDSDGNAHSGGAVERVRRKHILQRKRLQKKGTRGAKKKLKRVGGKEARYRRHANHVISKAIVETAKRTGRGIALEDLTGIRQRITARGGDARNRLGGWSFAQLGGFIGYKARLAGIPVIFVDPRNTSRTCNACGHCSKSNRRSQSEFSCVSCGSRTNADENAALNIRAQALLSVPQDCQASMA
jgi:putative transposase